MWIMTARGWRLLYTLSIPAPRDLTLYEIMYPAKKEDER